MEYVVGTNCPGKPLNQQVSSHDNQRMRRALMALNMDPNLVNQVRMFDCNCLESMTLDDETDIDL